MKQDLLRQIPKIDILLARPKLAGEQQEMSRSGIKKIAQEYLQQLRQGILAETVTELPAIEEIEQAILERVQTKAPYHLKRVINATGVVLHTNLGRAPLGKEAAERIAEIAGGYCNLEYDIDAGCRGSRYSHVENLICEMTGAEAALVVNNNAAAVFLMLNTLCKGKKVAISRGELVEIGGSFRVPEIMEQSGADLVEIGTTNKTHASDYEDAITERDASVLLKVHTSNFSIIGFTESVPVPDLCEIAKKHDALVLYDIGSCLPFPAEYIGIHQGETAKQALQEGADVVCFSGDKLMGSSQAGILVGRKEFIEKMKKNHLTRMLRVDKLSLAALEVTLRNSLDPKEAVKKVPIVHMLGMSRAEAQEKAQALQAILAPEMPSFIVDTVLTEDEVGGGSLPGVMLPSCAVAVSCENLSANEIEQYLRLRSKVTIITRIWKDRVLISPRTLCEGDEKDIMQAFRELEQLAREERKNV